MHHGEEQHLASGEVSEQRFEACGEELRQWAMPLAGRVAAVAVEATTGWRWVWRELSALGFDVCLADPGEVKGLSGEVVQLAAGASTTCARMKSGDVYCWGYSWSGQAGNGSAEISYDWVHPVGL